MTVWLRKMIANLTGAMDDYLVTKTIANLTGTMDDYLVT